MDPHLAGSLILAIGGCVFAFFGVLALRIAMKPTVAARVDALERQLDTEGKTLRALIGEATQAGIEARRLATRRKNKRERAEVDDDDEPVPVPHVELPGALPFRPGCDAFGRPFGGGAAPQPPESPADQLAARGLRVVDGKVEAAVA